MQKQESFLENQTHKILCGVETQLHNPIHARKPDLVFIHKINLVIHWILPFSQPTEKKIKECKTLDTYQDFDRE